MKISAVIFDMDGLLINSEPFWQEAEKIVFKDVGIRLTTEMCHTTVGLRIDEVVHHWFQQFPWEGISKKEIENRVVDKVIEFVKSDGKPMPGVFHALDFFRTRGIPMALASASYFKLIDATLDKLALRDQFSVIHSAELEPYGKPHPGIFLTTAKNLGVEPVSCLVFEDSLNGVLAAKAARMQCVCVPDPAHINDNRFSIADIKLNSLEEWNEKYM